MAKRKKNATGWEMSWTATTGDRVVVRNGRVTVTGGERPPGREHQPEKGSDPSVNPSARSRSR